MRARIITSLILLCTGIACAVNVAVFTFSPKVNAFVVPAALKGFTAMYKTELAAQADITVIERENLADVTSEIALGQTGLLTDKNAAVDSVKFEGVDFIIGGEISEVSGGRYRIDLSVREVKTAKIVAEKLTGNIVKHNDAAAKMLAHNTACLLLGKGAPIQKKVIPRRGALISTCVGLAGVATGIILRVVGKNKYEDYKVHQGTLDEIEDTFNRAQVLTNAGEITFVSASGLTLISAYFAFGKRKDRTLTRD